MAVICRAAVASAQECTPLPDVHHDLSSTQVVGDTDGDGLGELVWLRR